MDFKELTYKGMNFKAALLASLLLFSVSCGSNAGRREAEQTMTRPFPSVTPPAMMQEQQEIVEFMSMHFWDAFMAPAAGQGYRCDSLYVAGVLKGDVEQNLANFILGIELGRCVGIGITSYSTHGCQVGECLDFYTPSLVVRKMPVETVELVACHHVKQHLHFLLAMEMARFVQHKASPGETRLVLYHTAVHHLCFGKLFKRLEGIEAALVIRSLNDHSALLDAEFVCL